MSYPNLKFKGNKTFIALTQKEVIDVGTLEMYKIIDVYHAFIIEKKKKTTKISHQEMQEIIKKDDYYWYGKDCEVYHIKNNLYLVNY